MEFQQRKKITLGWWVALLILIVGGASYYSLYFFGNHWQNNSQAEESWLEASAHEILGKDAAIHLFFDINNDKKREACAYLPLNANLPKVANSVLCSHYVILGSAKWKTKKLLTATPDSVVALNTTLLKHKLRLKGYSINVDTLHFPTKILLVLLQQKDSEKDTIYLQWHQEKQYFSLMQQ